MVRTGFANPSSALRLLSGKTCPSRYLPRSLNLADQTAALPLLHIDRSIRSIDESIRSIDPSIHSIGRSIHAIDVTIRFLDVTIRSIDGSIRSIDVPIHSINVPIRRNVGAKHSVAHPSNPSTHHHPNASPK
jgi:hypothetical protein